MRIKKGDTVLIRAGKDRGRKGKVMKALPEKGMLTVEGINMRKKHVRPRRSGEKGQVVEMPGPLPISNVQLVCSKCGKAARVGYRADEKAKARICRKCGAEL